MQLIPSTQLQIKEAGAECSTGVGAAVDSAAAMAQRLRSSMTLSGLATDAEDLAETRRFAFSNSFPNGGFAVDPRKSLDEQAGESGI
jgi:hypothetical protein